MPKTDPVAGRAAVDAYLAKQPADRREALEDVRRRVAALVPDASEAISYGMPAFRYRDRYLVSYAGWARHCSFYPLTGASVEAHRAELEGLSIDKGTIRFVPPQRLSDELLQTIVAERRAAIDAGGR
ncbi:MAG TPA: DUF1801 domain-containing protein [Candidatus Limnocylindrales bacterium]|jgi:uncharacterized protein YdhG (YjbR/CyaY superfamily)